MKRILIVDDNPSKLDGLVYAAKSLFPQAEVMTFRCQSDILCAIQRDYAEEFVDAPEQQLLIIDMQMPFDVGERVELESGLGVLNWLEQYEFQCPAIITSSEQIDEKLAREAYEHYVGFLRYSVLVSPTGAMRELLAEYLPG